MGRRTLRRDPPDAGAALDAALRFLTSRPRSAREVQDRLRRAGCGEDIIAATVDRLSDLGYVDDFAFAAWWMEQRDRHAPRGRRLLEAELRQKGVPVDVIERLREEPPERPAEEPLPDTDDQRAIAVVEHHLRGRPLPDDPKGLQRLGMFLMRRGFDAETARQAIRHLKSRTEDG
jgi:regulatory protein